MRSQAWLVAFVIAAGLSVTSNGFAGSGLSAKAVNDSIARGVLGSYEMGRWINIDSLVSFAKGRCSP